MDFIIHSLLLIINATKEGDTYHDIARILLEHIDKLETMNITEMADLCFVSPSTFSRFVHELGYKNFNLFKANFHETYGFEIDYENDFIDDQVPLDKKLALYQTQAIDSLEAMREQLDIQQLKQLAKQIHDMDNVYILGTSNYQFLALYLQARLSLFKKIIFVTLDQHRQADVVASLTDQDLAIFISPNGNTQQRLNYISTLYKNHVHTVLITHNTFAINKDKYESSIILGGNGHNNLGMLSIMYFIDQLILTYYDLYADALMV